VNDNCFDLNKVLNERLHDKLMKLIFYILGIILLIYALLGPLQYAEIDSYALPVISLEYRGSLIINQLDINIAQKDFTQFYNGIKEFDDLRSAKLLQLNEESWVSWYFPAYSLICIPFKVMLQVLNLQQERAFSIANVFLYLLALNTVRLKLKMPIKAKFLLFLLLIVNPVTLKYINFCSAEVYIFAFVIISLVFFYNRNYHLAGLYVCIASLSNPAIMAWGIIVFIYFFVSIYTGSSKAIGKVLLENKQKIFEIQLFLFYSDKTILKNRKSLTIFIKSSRNILAFSYRINCSLLFLFMPSIITAMIRTLSRLHKEALIGCLFFHKYLWRYYHEQISPLFIKNI